MSEKVVQIVLNSFVQDSRVMRVCKSLSIEGYKVTVLALHDEGLEEQEELDGYHIHRIKVVSKSLSKQPIIHILKYVEFLFKAIFEINKIRPHIIHGHDPNGLFIAWLAKKLWKSRLIYDSHEYWPGAVHQTGRYKSIFKFGVEIEKYCIKKADKVITVNTSIAELIGKIYTLEDVVVIRNIPEKATAIQIDMNNIKFPPCEFNIIYTGNVEEGRGIKHIISAMAAIRDEIGLVIVGRDSLYKKKMKSFSRSLKLQDRIYFLPAVSPNEIVSLCRVAQAGIASIRNVCESYYLSLPNKIFEYIHAGIPVLVNNLPEMAALVKNQKIGLCFDINTVSSIVDTIHQMYEDTEHYNQFCKNAVTASQTLNWECEQKQLLQLYKGLVSA